MLDDSRSCPAGVRANFPPKTATVPGIAAGNCCLFAEPLTHRLVCRFTRDDVTYRPLCAWRARKPRLPHPEERPMITAADLRTCTVKDLVGHGPQTQSPGLARDA